MELSIKYGDKVEMKKISAVFKPYVQAALQIDVLDGSLNLNEEGTACMILLKKRTNMKAFQERFEGKDTIGFRHCKILISIRNWQSLQNHSPIDS